MNIEELRAAQQEAAAVVIRRTSAHPDQYQTHQIAGIPTEIRESDPAGPILAALRAVHDSVIAEIRLQAALLREN